MKESFQWIRGCDRYILVTGHGNQWKARAVENFEVKKLGDFTSKIEATQAGLTALPDAPVLDGIERCVHCGELNCEDYMVDRALWGAALHPLGGRLHLKCLEERIGRLLTIDDFTDVRANNTLRFGYALPDRRPFSTPPVGDDLSGEEAWGSSYSPSGDKGCSLVLVAYMASGSAEERGHLKVLTSFGAGFDSAMYGDKSTTMWWLTEDLKGKPDGIYVLECLWTGTDEDAHFDVKEIRVLSAGERSSIYIDDDFKAVNHLWGKDWIDVPCRWCKHPLSHHYDFDMDCPKTESDAKKGVDFWAT